MSRSAVPLPAQGHFVRPVLTLAEPARRVAWFALALLIISVLAYRLGGVPTPALVASLLLTGTLLLCALAVGLTGLARAWFQAARGGSSALAAACVAFVGLVPFALAILLASENPFANVAYTTGFTPTPAGATSPLPRPAADTTANSVVALPARHYAASPTSVAENVRTVLEGLGWTIEDIRATDLDGNAFPQGDPLGVIRDSGAIPLPIPRSSFESEETEDGRALPERDLYTIDANVSDWLLGLPSDVVIRIGAEPGGTVVDMRSISREIGLDFGQNRRFIASFLEALDVAMAGAQPIPG